MYEELCIRIYNYNIFSHIYMKLLKEIKNHYGQNSKKNKDSESTELPLFAAQIHFIKLDGN